MLVLMVSGVLTVTESLAGFADPVVMIIVAMFIVSQALVNTGIAQRIGEMVMTAGRGRGGGLHEFHCCRGHFYSHYPFRGHKIRAQS